MARAGVEREENYKTGLLDPPLPKGAATVGYVAAAGPSLATPQLAAADALNSATLGFLTAHALQDARREKVKREAESEKQAERDWQLKLQNLVALRLKELEEEVKEVDERRASATSSSRPEQGKRRKRKKRNMRKLPRAPRPRCGRPCALRRQVPAVQGVRDDSASASVHRRLLDTPVVQQRQVRVPMVLKTGFSTVAVHRLPSTSLSCCRGSSSWSSLFSRSSRFPSCVRCQVVDVPILQVVQVIDVPFVTQRLIPGCSWTWWSMRPLCRSCRSRESHRCWL